MTRVLTPPGPPLFRGTYVYALDPKGRLVVPQPFRKLLGQEAFVVRAPGNALLLVSQAQWLAAEARWLDAPQFRNYFLSGAHPVSFQHQSGRVNIPFALRDHAGLSRGAEVAVAGLGNVAVVVAWRVWKERLSLIEDDLDGLRTLIPPASRRLTDHLGGAIAPLLPGLIQP